MKPINRLDYKAIFLGLPIAAIVARERVIMDCNDAALSLFRALRKDVVRQPFSVLYPDLDEFEAAGRRMEPSLIGGVRQDDNRIMRRLDGSHFWVRVRGHAFNPAVPHEMTAWLFSEITEDRDGQKTAISLTRRERDVAALLVDKLTSKQIAIALGISPKTVDIHRGSLLKKYSAKSTSELIGMLRA